MSQAPVTPPRPPRSPHDALVRGVFEDPRLARHLLVLVIPPGLRGLLDLGTLRLVRGEFVDPALRPSATDLLFEVDLVQGAGTLLVLLEHQSVLERDAPYVVQAYCERLWDRHVRQDGSPLALPALLGLVLFQGPGAWTGPRRLSELIALPAGAEALRGFQPELALEVHELGAHGRGELLHASGPALARVALALLREARAERDFEALWHAALGLVPELLGAWGAGFGLLARYTLHQAGRDVMARVQDEVLREHGREAVAPFVTAAAALQAEGRADALRAATLQIVEERLGRAARERVAPVVAAATLEELEVLVVRAAIIRAPDELGPPTRPAP